MNNNVDIVITWVDGSDPNWLAEKKMYTKKSNNVRYRDWDNLVYIFRGIEQFMPWVHKIYFVTWGHLPKWLNIDNEKLVIVNHQDYIPEKYLPTFNSNVLDLNMFRMIYRGNGWPGRVTAVRNNGQEYSMDYNTAWMSILGRVIRRSCKFCVDSIGEAADISCGDYWKLDENNNPSFEEADGVNCIFTWTNKGNELLNLIAKEKNICIQKENIDKLKYAQPNHFNRRCTILYKTIAMRMFFRKSPKYAFSKMFLLAKYKSLRDGFRIFKGTVKRILQGRI